jgi:O-antigen/teichoic acid export membrane protein
MAKFGSATIVGHYGLALAFVTPVVSFFDLQLRNLQATDAARRYTFDDYMYVRLGAVCAALAVVAVVALVPGSSQLQTSLILLVAAALLVRSVSDIYCGYFQQAGRQDKMSQSRIVGSIGQLLGYLVGLVIIGDLIASVLLASVAGTIAIFVFDVPTKRSLDRSLGSPPKPAIKSRKSQLLSLCRQAVPLGAVSFMLAFRDSIPRLFLTDHVSTSELGVFVALASLVAMVVSMSAVFTQVLSPRLAQMYFRGFRSDFIRLLVLIELGACLLLILAPTVAYFVGPDVARIFYSDEYGQNRALIVWLAVLAGLRFAGLFVGIVLTVMRSVTSQFIVNLASLFILGVGCVWLIPQTGILGAAQALVMAACFQLLLNGITCIRLLTRWDVTQTPSNTGATVARDVTR